jgi:AcrR family transcriptional regulator
MQSDETKKTRIVEFAIKNFLSVGYNPVTMEDIARGVGMGKGTIYKLFPSKETLLLCAIDFFAGRIETSIKKIVSDEKLTGVEKLNAYLTTVLGKLSVIKPELLSNLKRSVPQAYEKIEETRQRIIMTYLVQLFEDGKKTGTYDPELDTQLAAHIVVGSIKHFSDAQVLSTFQYSVDEILRMVITVILKGCLTEESKRLIFNK